jgi:WD40 repeat protein
MPHSYTTIGMASTDPDWHNIDRALYNVTEGIRKVLEEVTSKLSPPSPTIPIQPSQSEQALPPASVLKQEPAKPKPLVKPEDFALRCTRTLTGHEGPILSVAISPDGLTLVSGSSDNTIRI